MKQTSEAVTPIEKDWFKTWFNSAYYHQLYAHRDEKEAANFINALVGYLRPAQGSRMLDIACGKGRHARMLAEKGFSVTGIDLATASISDAKKFETPSLEFYEHDMRIPFRDDFFDYVFNLFTSFGYFDSEEDNHRVIDMFTRCLKPNGTLVMDYLNVNRAIRSQTDGEIKNVDGIVYDISRWSDERNLYKRIAVYDSGKDAVVEWTEKVARLELDDFYHLFAAHGLRIVKTFGDYNMERFHPLYSPRLIMVVEKG
jgi:SAM-dependent methyltransferase